MQEFDQYAAGYSAGMEHPIKQMLAGSAVDFLRPKAKLLKKLIGTPQQNIRLLDFGCGCGDFLNLLASECSNWKLMGTDVSEEMMNEAVRRYGDKYMPFELLSIDHAMKPDSYDIITASCVFHHIPPNNWKHTMLQIADSLKANGKVVIFEHNPRNPLTTWVVSRTPIDANATLLDMADVKNLMIAANLKIIAQQSFLFGPPHWKLTSFIDWTLGWTCLGGQYFIAGEK